MLNFEALRRSPKPNNFLVLPEGLSLSEAADELSPNFDESQDQLYTRLKIIIEQTPGWSLNEESLDDKQLSFIATTPFLRFKDDIDIKIYPTKDNAGSVLAIYSRSRIGHSDFGANKKRVKSLLGFL